MYALLFFLLYQHQFWRMHFLLKSLCSNSFLPKYQRENILLLFYRDSLTTTHANFECQTHLTWAGIRIAL